MKLISKITNRLALGRRLSNFKKYRNFSRLDDLKDTICYKKYPKEEKQREALEKTVSDIVNVASSNSATSLATRAGHDMKKLVKDLGSVEANPEPMPFTMFKTEAEAVVGCATPPRSGALVYGIVSVLSPDRVIEFGAAHGYGSVYIGSALLRNGHGALVTLEGMDVRCRIAKKTISRFNLQSLVTVIDGDFSKSLHVASNLLGGVDLAFCDGDKSVESTMWQFEKISTEMSEGGYILFDDINFNLEISELWDEIVDHECVSAAVTIYGRYGLVRIR